jgi:polyhydroxyalkanoate synthesis repressor PhaR
MPVIKRYPNRKLYDTEAKRYITLDGIAALIRDGEEVTIIDHKTNEDLTALTLTQIIFEQEKKQSGFLPKSVLTGLVRTGGDTLNSLRRGLSTPLDLVKQVDSEIDRRFQVLISKGELARDEGIRMRDKLLSFSHRGEETMDEEELSQLLGQHDIPTREELDHLNQQIQILTRQLDGLLQTTAPMSDAPEPSLEKDSEAI